MFSLFTRKVFKLWLIIGVISLGMFGVILLLQYHRGSKKPITNIEPLSTVQTSPEAQRRLVKLPSTKSPIIKTAEESAETEQSQSKDLENAPTVLNDSEPIFVPDKTETIHSIVESLSVEDLEELDGLTLKEFLSDEELEKLDREISKSLEEFVVLVPKIVEHKAELDEITVYNNNLAEQEGWWEDKGKSEEVAKNNELIKEMLNELATLRSQATDLESILLDSDFDSIGTQRDKAWIRQLAEDIWN